MPASRTTSETSPGTPPPAGRASRWRARVAAADPDRESDIATLAAGRVDATAIAGVVAHERASGWRDEAHLSAGLRRTRVRVVAALLDRDLDRRADLDEVVTAMTALAEAVVGEALPFLSRTLAARHGTPCGSAGAPQDLLVVGMGKLGGGELNVSSDIDLVFLYDEEGETAGAADGRALSNMEFFTRVGRRLIAVLSEFTADGFVFRVDMRLRPDGDSGPLVMSLAMFERYLVTSARDWERFAWIKGRVISPPVFARPDPTTLDAVVTPFVYRRYLDFGAIDALRRLHGQIRDEAARRDGARRSRGAGTDAPSRIDVKLGRGGIREIEFIAQHFQLIRGGREPWLRLRPTRATLSRLVDEGLLERDVGARLLEAYVFLRDVEHRLQYVDDAQTHTLPPRTAEDDRLRVAAMCAPLLPPDERATFDDLVVALQAYREFVGEQFDAIFGATAPPVAADAAHGDVWGALIGGGPGETDDTVDESSCERLRAAGIDPPEVPFARLVALARGARLRTLSPAGRARLDTLMPRLIDAAAGTAAPAATLARWVDLVEAIAGRSAYLALLEEYPGVRTSVTRLLAASPWAAQYLARHPLLLDELIDAPDRPDAPQDQDAWRSYWERVATALDRQMRDAGGDAERQMDLLREAHHVETFRLLVEDLEGRLSVETLSDQLSALADLVIAAAIRHGWAHFAARRAHAPAVPAFAVIAYGKLGGKELGYASDLDLVFLFDARGDDEATETYARFAQRLTVWLTARTVAGLLFEIDLRLRPDGAAGLVASSFDAWSRYERRTDDVGAWTWEHQALTRARFCAGDAELGARFEAERRAILVARRFDGEARARLRSEIAAMRVRMHDGHPNRTAAFDLKHDAGGMVDIEFAVQYLVLGFGGDHPELLDDVGNIALLARAASAGLVGSDLATSCGAAYRTYRSRQHAIRLADPGAHARVDGDELTRERAVVARLWSALFD